MRAISTFSFCGYLIMSFGCVSGQSTDHLGTPIETIHVRPFYCIRIAPNRVLSDPALVDTSIVPRRATKTFQSLTKLFAEFTKDIREDLPHLLSHINITPSPKDFPEFIQSDNLVSITAEGVKRAIRNLQTSERSVRVCFVISHGNGGSLALDQATELPIGDLVESFYVRAEPRPHLAVVIVDACEAGNLRSGDGESRLKTGGVWKSLYFGHQGVVLLTSASRHQKAYLLDGESLFVSSFMKLFDEEVYPRQVFAANGQLISWDRFFEVLRREYRIQYELKMAKRFAGTPSDVGAADQLRPRSIVQNFTQEDRKRWDCAYAKWLEVADEWAEKCSRGEVASNQAKQAGTAQPMDAKDALATLLKTNSRKLLYDKLGRDDKMYVDCRIAGPPSPSLNERAEKNVNAQAMAKELRWRPNDVLK